MIKRLITGLLIGLVSVLMVMQHDPWIKMHVAQQVMHYAPQVYHCALSCTCDELNLFAGHIILHDVQVASLQHDEHWSWHTPMLRIKISWLQLLLYGICEIVVELETVQAQAYVKDQQLDIADHLYCLLATQETGIHTLLDRIHIRDMRIQIDDDQHNVQAQVVGDLQMHKVDNRYAAVIDLYDGALHWHDRSLCEHISGSLQLDIFDGRPYLDMSLAGVTALHLAQLGQEATPCTIACSWQDTRGVLSIKNVDNTFVIDPIVVTYHEHASTIALNAQVPVGYMWRMVYPEEQAPVSGSCALELKWKQRNDAPQIQGQLTAQRITWREYEIASLGRISFQSTTDGFKGDLYMQRTSGACVGGQWQIDPSLLRASAHLKNSSRLSLSPEHDWHILPDDSNAIIQLDADGTLTAKYELKATHAKSFDSVPSSGTITLTDSVLKIDALVDKAHISADIVHQPEYVCNHFTITKDQQLLASMRKYEEGHQGHLDISCVKEVLKRLYQFNLQGEGKFIFDAQVQPTGCQIACHFDQGAIRLPHTYNFIHGLEAKITVGADHQIQMQDFICRLHHGNVRSSSIRIHVGADGQLKTWYAPLLIEHCLLNMENDLFALISGDMLCFKHENATPMLQGNILIERAQVKGNIFSAVFQKNMRNFTARSFDPGGAKMQCDVTVQTKHPIKIQTPFFVSDARINVHCAHTGSHPIVTGSVQLQGGQLNFPYRPLYIAKGALHFMPGKLDDPLLELMAKNSIRQHNIMLQVTGSLQDHQVTLESSPSLTEEQILSLLLVGSQEESLNMMMPALLMQNIKALIFGYDQSTSAMSRQFNSFFKPFRRIHLVPSFVDQSGRGGLRGAVEIDISDRWRATIEKNFSLTEDTRFELEYLFSDDVSMRIVRDIRRDVIGEVETRWKFGR